MTENFHLKTEDGLALEAVFDGAGDPKAILVFCHPHPQMGGTMNAPLLLAVRDHMIQLGWGVLRFNFRGIGHSEGTAGIGIEERKDATAAVEEAKRRYPDLPVAIAGWSFGAAVAIHVASGRDDLVACLAIAPAVKEKPGITAGLPPAGEIQMPLPTHFIVGINDDLVEPAACEEWAASSGATCLVMKGANHFFWAKYEKLAEESARFLEASIP